MPAIVQRQPSVSPVMSDGANISVSCAATFVAFPEAVCAQLTIVNDTGTDLEWQQGGAGEALTVVDGSSFTIFGIHDAAQIGVRRKDVSATAVTAKARWEV